MIFPIVFGPPRRLRGHFLPVRRLHDGVLLAVVNEVSRPLRTCGLRALGRPGRSATLVR